MGDFNITPTEEELQDFLEEQDLSNLVHFPTCFKSLDNPSTIDLIITNHKSSFQNTISVSTGLSDFHKMVITSMKTTTTTLLVSTEAATKLGDVRRKGLCGTNGAQQFC